MNADPFFYNATPSITNKNPFLNRNQFGATLGGPIKKDKLFYFLSYQGVRIADAQSSLDSSVVPFSLTNDRSPTGVINAMQASYGVTLTPNQLNSAAMNLLNAKLPNGQYLIPSPSAATVAAGLSNAVALGNDITVQGPNTYSTVNQGIADLDYVVSDKDRLSLKYYIQDDPTTNPFGSDNYLLGFRQQLSAGSQVISIANTTTVSPNLTWEQHVGFTRLHVFASTASAFNPTSEGISLPGAATFPNIDISTGDPNFTGACHSAQAQVLAMRVCTRINGNTKLP